MLLLITGCKKKDEEPITDTSTGPYVPESTATPEEKELAMIQECISDYNNGDIEKLEEKQEDVEPAEREECQYLEGYVKVALEVDQEEIG